MKANMGTLDKVVRLLVAGIIIILYFTGIISATPALIFLALAAAFILTSFIGFCPLYCPFGFSTSKRK